MIKPHGLAVVRWFNKKKNITGRIKVRSWFLFISLSQFSFTVTAMPPLEQHITFVAQGMSAFYMYMLSDGDEKYLRDFNQYQLSADLSLLKTSQAERANYLTQWRSITPKLNHQYFDGEGIFFDGFTRTLYRNYLTDLYLRFQKSKNIKNDDFQSILDRIQVLNSLLTARVLDVVSADYGEMGLTEEDIQFNPKDVAQVVERDINRLLQADGDKNQKKVLQKISNRFKFIKNTLVDYKSETAYLMIYGSMKTMNKEFTKHKTRFVVSNQ